MEKHITKLALHIFNWYAKEWAKYELDCADYAKDGYRPARCFHGTNLWTDYDPICGPCEDGYGWFDRNLFRELAISQAKQAFEEFNERLDFYQKASTLHAPLDQGKIIQWVGAPLQQWGEFHASNRVVVAYEPPF